MSWRNVKLIFLREVLDQLRDRRTLFMVAVLPLLLYPLMGIGMFQMTAIFSEQPRTVVILGVDNLPDLPLLNGDHFARTWFRISTDADKLRVIADGAETVPSADKLENAARAKIIEQAQQMRELLKLRVNAEAELEAARDTKRPLDEILALESRVQQLSEPLAQRFQASGIQVLIIVPPEFKQNLLQLRDDLAQRGPAEKSLAGIDYPRPLIVQNSADEKSVIAHNRVTEVMREWERSLLRKYLRESGLPEHLPTPINPTPIDLAAADQVSANVWSKLFPSLLVIMALTGAFYPAVDLGAGEKERGTMETLLICPATRTEIVLGKFLTVMLFSASTALLNLSSLGFTGKYMASLASGGGGVASKFGDLALPPFSSLVWILVMLVPLASLFSALCLAFATFARSSKEGQYYLTPLLMVTMGLTVFCSSPAVDIEPFYSVIPVMGPALLLKGLLKANGPDMTLYVYAIPVLLTSIGYSLLALWWAIDQFGREEVLFREAERFDLRLWVKHLLRDKEPTPSFTEAGFCFLLILLLQFLSMKSMQMAMRVATPEEQGILQVQLLLIQQIALIATPALMMGVMLTTSLRKTFSLRWPGWWRLTWAVLLPFALHPLVVELQVSLQWFFPKPPPGLADALKLMSSDALPLWLVILAFAAAPAICEEIAFRGFMLSGFSRTGKVSLAVTLSSLAFGIIHMIPQQVFNASLLGIVLGMMCIRSRSLLPGIAFHFVNNVLAILHGRMGEAVPETGVWSWLFRHSDGILRYQPALLCLAALAAIALLHRLTRHPRSETAEPGTNNVDRPLQVLTMS
eukprot:TRINITY_DN1080_c0_g1_i12.p1 TRINITY_DN1080_c0_g1~~TRINITY_DN1080_c0_g1_i12.p1  ORF type:complete len:805 (+),score=209.61 TRINITY_DN1080_c0_g1_i12:1054-3468(+)